jgi:6-phosphogluconolactonase
MFLLTLFSQIKSCHVKTIFAVCFLFFSTFGYGQKTDYSYDLLIGSYSDADSVNGIYVYQFDVQSGIARYRSCARGFKNPSYFTISRDEKFVFSVSDEGKGLGKINGFNFDAFSGELSYINSVGSGGDGPCYISIDPENRYVICANYDGGTISAVPVAPDGSLDAPAQVIRYNGHGQDQSHIHACFLSGDSRFLFVTDLGTDKVHVYPFDKNRKEPIDAAVSRLITVHPGAGPRHLTLHPNGKWAFLINEMEGSVTSFNYSKGKLSTRQTVSLLRKEYKGNAEASDIHVSPDGKFLYASLRAEINEVVIYAIGKNGKLKFAGRQSSMGKTPRNFVLDPSGNFLLVANQNSNEIIIFRRDHMNGLLKDTGQKISISTPLCLKFVNSEIDQ